MMSIFQACRYLVFCNLTKHRVNEFLLLHQPLPDISRLEWLLRKLADSFRLLLSPDSLLKNFQPVVKVLSIQLRPVADTSDTSQNGFVTDMRRLWPEAGDHGDSLATSQSLEGLVFDVSALQHHCGSLWQKLTD